MVANRNLPLTADSAAEALTFDPPHRRGTAKRRHRCRDGPLRRRHQRPGTGSDAAVTRAKDARRSPQDAPQRRDCRDLDRLVHRRAGPTGLRLPPNTCIVLDGTITAATDQPSDNESAQAPTTQLVLMPSKGVASIAGGVLDGAGRPQHVVNAPGAAVVVLDGVTVRRSGYNGITTKERHILTGRCSSAAAASRRTPIAASGFTSAAAFMRSPTSATPTAPTGSTSTPTGETVRLCSTVYGQPAARRVCRGARHGRQHDLRQPAARQPESRDLPVQLVKNQAAGPEPAGVQRLRGDPAATASVSGR